jgi:class 3 adenylate cyclase
MTRRVCYPGAVTKGSQGGGVGERADALMDTLAWSLARGAVDAVRYQPAHLDLAVACGASQPDVPPRLAYWLAEARALPAVRVLRKLPHAGVRLTSTLAARWFGPTASAVVRWASGAVAARADQVGAATLQRPLRARVHPGMLVPHPHAVAVLALDMRGFSLLTRVLHDTQYLADLIGEYLSELTRVVERHRGVVFQYTGDGLLALFLPELAGMEDGPMLERVVHATSAELHEAFQTMRQRWRDEWRASGRDGVDVGLGIGVSFGRATIGLLGPSGKKQFGVIGEPVNLAAFLCSQAPAGMALVDRGSFLRAGAEPPRLPVRRLKSRKRHQRIDVLRLRYTAARPIRPTAAAGS